MMPIVRATAFEDRVAERSYSPAFLGWLSAMHDSFPRDSRCGLLSPRLCACHTAGERDC